MSIPDRVAVIGAGEIGSGWAALFAAHGSHVRLLDPARRAIDRARSALDCARRIGVGGDTKPGSIRISRTLAGALDGAGWVQESLPESEALKRGALAAMDDALADGAIVASSTSAMLASTLGKDRPFADRFLIAHPLQPVYAVRIVELCASPETSADTMSRAVDVLRALGREPVVVRGELPGLVANRLTAALLREAFELVAAGAVTADELDAIVARGVATGWTAAGALGTEAVGAGAGGLALFVERFADPLAEIWRSLAQWTELDDARRAALLARFAEMRASDGRDECEWAETLARIERSAGG